MSSYKKVVVAGATGTLGPWIVNALLDAGFEVTTLSRTGRTDTQDRTGKKTGTLTSGIKVVQVDYDSLESLVNAFAGQDAVVSNMPNYEGQPLMIGAAIKAGVKRFLPSEFGSNVSGNEKNAALPVFKDGKTAIQKYLIERTDQISYTLIVNGYFLDWVIEVGVLPNPKGGPVKIFNGGNSKHSMTIRSDIAKAVVGVLKHPDDTQNRAVYVHSATVSQNELLEICKKINPGFKPEIQHTTTDEVLRKSYAALEKGEEVGSAMQGFISVSCWGEGYGNNWADTSDNELLGIKELTRSELEKLVGQFT